MIMADFLILFSLQNSASASASDKLGRGCKVLRQGGGAIGLPVRGLELLGGSRAPILPHFPNYTFPTQGPLPGNYSSMQQLTRPCWRGLVMIMMVVVMLVMVMMVVVMLSRMTMVVVMLVMMTMEMVMLLMVVMAMVMLVMVVMPEF